MARTEIKWRERDKKELARQIKNFNAKVKRLEKKEEMEGVLLPEPLKLKEVIARIDTRRDFNQELSDLTRFTKRGAKIKPVTSEGGLTVTNWELHIVKRNVRRVNREREPEYEQRRQAEVKLRGEPVGYTRDMMGSQRIRELLPMQFDFANMKDARNWRAKVIASKKHSSGNAMEKTDKRWKDNYIKSMILNGLDEDLVDMLRAVPLSTFTSVMYSEELADIPFNYGPEEASAKSKEIRGIWKKYVPESSLKSIQKKYPYYQ